MVTVALMTVVLGFVTRGFVGLQNAAAGASLRLQNLEEARTIMNAVSKDLRTAARLSSTSSPFDVTLPTLGTGSRSPTGAPRGAPRRRPTTGVTNTEVWFYANLTLGTADNPTPCPDIVHLYVNTLVSPNVLREQMVPADAGGHASDLFLQRCADDAPCRHVRREPEHLAGLHVLLRQRGGQPGVLRERRIAGEPAVHQPARA